MPSLSEQRVGTRRQAMRSWIPISIVALLCVAFVVGVFAVQNSWWTAEDPQPTADQAASDGMSVFSGPGVDFLAREGVVRVKVRTDALPAAELGLEPEAARTIEPIVPVRAVVLGADGAFTVDLVKSFTLTTANDRVDAVELVQDGRGRWTAIYPQLERIAPAWGWTEEQLEQLQTDLATASRNSSAPTYSARLPEVVHKGALVSAEVTIDVDGGDVGLAFTIRTSA